MSKTWTRLGLAACTVVIASCTDPSFQLEGHVIDLRGAPIAGARAQLVCGLTVAQAQSTADANGYFRSTAPSPRANSCTIEIAAEGHLTVRLRLGAHCAAARDGDTCGAGHLDLVMP
jgi:hypothetical protein